MSRKRSRQKVAKAKSYFVNVAEFMRPADDAQEVTNPTKEKSAEKQRKANSNKGHLCYLHTRLLCLDCGEVKRVIDAKNETATLECGHVRPTLTLPPSMQRPELTPEERKIAERMDDPEAKLEQELLDNMIHQMRIEDGIVDCGAF